MCLEEGGDLKAHPGASYSVCVSVCVCWIDGGAVGGGVQVRRQDKIRLTTEGGA